MGEIAYSLAVEPPKAPDVWKRGLVPGWRWRDREGGFHDPSSMETRHLFHVFRMIWNNTCPPHLRVGQVRLYRFGPGYTKAYLAEAVQHCGRELLSRDDLTNEWQRQLNLIAGFFAQGEEVCEKRLRSPALALAPATQPGSGE